MVRIALEEEQTQQLERNDIASEDPSYHAIKVYNMIEDSLWEQLDQLGNATNMGDVSKIAREVRILLLRGDKVWNEIKNSITIKASILRIKTTSFQYGGELQKHAEQISSLLKISLNAQYLISNGSLEEQEAASAYLEMPPNVRLGFIIQEIEKIILLATELWGQKAAEINFTMPINIKDTRDPFL